MSCGALGSIRTRGTSSLLGPYLKCDAALNRLMNAHKCATFYFNVTQINRNT